MGLFYYRYVGLVLFFIPISFGCWDLPLSERPKEPSDGTKTATDTDTAGTDSETAPNHPCDGIRCNAPPAGRCDEINTVHKYAASGYCDIDNDQPICRYPSFIESCMSGQCIDGQCPKLPAQGRQCPIPEPFCDGNVLVVANEAVAATVGFTFECRYQTERIPCTGGCENGHCLKTPCLGVTCFSPPARYCNGNDLITWSVVGRCDDSGRCRYSRITTPCDNGCEDGRCRDTDTCLYTDCRTPPANFCIDDQRLYAYDHRGFCENGACIYRGNTIDCPCRDGICQNDPCIAKTCDTPPPPQCENDNTLTAWNSRAGQCVKGRCNYEMQSLSCKGSCKNGACDDPCIGMDDYCNSIPAPPDFCDETSVYFYESAASCTDNGVCKWIGKTEGCIQCENAVCIDF